jgi:hypothetical protein
MKTPIRTHDVGDGECMLVDSDGCALHLESFSNSDAFHIVSCVNALQGLNPAAIKGLVEAAEECIEMNGGTQNLVDALAAARRVP